MSSPAPFNDVRTRLIAANLGYPIAWPNEPFTRPNPPAPWLQVEVTATMDAPADLGGDVWQEEGTAYISVFVPAGTGTDAARTIAKAVSTVFRALGPADVVYLGGAIGEGSTAEANGMWWCLPVSVDWKYQDTTS